MGIFTQSRLHTYPQGFHLHFCHTMSYRNLKGPFRSLHTHSCAMRYLLPTNLSLMSDLSYALDNLLTNYLTRLYQSYILYSLIKPYMTYMTLYPLETAQKLSRCRR